MGALLAWYLVAEATMVTESVKNAIDIANQTLEIAQNPRINNTFFIVALKILLAKAYMETSDYETAKMCLESGLVLAKKYSMNDMMSRIYLLYGKYYNDIGTIQSPNQIEYLKGASKMYDKANEIVVKITHNTYLRENLDNKKSALSDYCMKNHFTI